MIMAKSYCLMMDFFLTIAIFNFETTPESCVCGTIFNIYVFMEE